jgi:protein-tyrosine phosphatase
MTASPSPDPRHLAFEGGANARDLGGYAGAGGRALRRGRIYRSAELTGLPPADIARLDELGLAVVFDLRSNGERRRRPCELPGTATRRIAWRDYRHTDADLFALLNDPHVTAANVRGVMDAMYRRIPHEQAESFRTILTTIAGSELPILFYCAAGKDRTGVLAALLMELMQVSREEIFAEYELTNVHQETLRERFLRYGRRDNVDDRVWEPMIIADRGYLEATFDEIDARHGGVRSYVAGYLGLGEETVAALERELLEPAPASSP